MKTHTQELASLLRLSDGRPNLALMNSELTAACDHAVDRIRDMVHDEATRFCLWPGQQRDGRKPSRADIKPWPGASDVRMRLTDEIINDQVALMKIAGRKARVTIRGTESSDMGDAAKTQVYLNHLQGVRLASMVNRESELVAQWRQTHGYALMGVTWRQEWERVYETITLEQLTAAATEAPDSPAALILAALYNTEREVMRDLAKVLAEMYEDLDVGEAYKQLRALRLTGRMEVPTRNLRVNQPEWEALKPWRDVFHPFNVEKIQASPWIAWRVTLTTAQLHERRVSERWSEAFVEKVEKTVGATILDRIDRPEHSGRRREVMRDNTEEMDGLHELFYLYYTQVDENGVPCKYRTVMSPHIVGTAEDDPADLVGADGPMPEEHGLYPFVELRRDRVDRMLIEGRGVAGLGATQQAAAKHARDVRVDQTDLQLQPPTIRPEREIGLPLTIRPRGEIGERRASQTRPYVAGVGGQAAAPIEDVARQDALQYFARNIAENPVRARAYEQDMVEEWLGELGECWKLTLQLAQQFEGDVSFARIVGQKAVPFTLSRADIQGSWDMRLVFNTDTLDPEVMDARTNRLKVYTSMDRAAIINMAPVVAGLFAQDFPEFSAEAIQGVEQAGRKEVDEEQVIYAKAMVGVESPMFEDGQNFALRLQWLQNQLALPGSQARLAAQPDGAELVMKRLQHLQFMVQQGVNAETGAVGVEAGPGA